MRKQEGMNSEKVTSDMRAVAQTVFADSSAMAAADPFTAGVQVWCDRALIATMTFFSS